MVGTSCSSLVLPSLQVYHQAVGGESYPITKRISAMAAVRGATHKQCRDDSDPNDNPAAARCNMTHACFESNSDNDDAPVSHAPLPYLLTNLPIAAPLQFSLSMSQAYG